MDRLEAMSLFLAIVEAGSLSGAARRLGLPLATLSRRLAELETRLKTKLFVRTTRHLSLTDSGQAFVPACKRILDAMAEAERMVGGEYKTPRGDLTLTAPIVFGRLHMVPVIGDFLAAYPEVSVRLIQSDRVADLLEDHLDVALRIGTLPDSTLLAVRVGEIFRVLCASPDYLARRGTPAGPDDLASHDLINFDGLVSAQGWIFEHGARALAVPVKSRLVTNTAEAAIDAALGGAGITRVLSYQVAHYIRQGRLVRLLPAWEPAKVPVSLVHAGGKSAPLKVRAFLDFAIPRLKDRLASQAI